MLRKGGRSVSSSAETNDVDGWEGEDPAALGFALDAGEGALWGSEGRGRFRGRPGGIVCYALIAAKRIFNQVGRCATCVPK